MPGLKLQVTTAGRAALVNPPNTGTNAVLVSHVGIASAPFAVSAALTALPNEIKRLATIGGTITADDTLHVSIRDESTAVYECYGFGLYLSDGTLFAVYSQQALLLGKAAASVMLLALDAIFVDIDVQQITFGATNFTDPAATTETPGIVELATEDEAAAGTDRVRAITAWLLKKVLDTRLGAAAPSDFVRTLLGLTTAALFRASLELKGAALRDEGDGNGLDADKLDGKHASDFASAGHTHAVPDSGVTAGKYGGASTIPVVTVDKAGRVTLVETIKVSVTDVDGVLPLKSGGTGAKTKEDARTALGLGTAATSNTGTSGATVPLLSTANTWADLQTFSTLLRANTAVQSPVYSANVTSIFFRPNGPNSQAGQAYLQTDGLLFVGSTIVSGGTVKSYGGTLQAGSDTGTFITLNYAGQFSSSISVNGTIGASGGFQPISSRELKTAFRPNPYGLREVLQLRTTLGKYRKWFNSDGRERVFLIAENIAELMPQVAAGAGITAMPPRERTPRKFKGYAIEQLLAVYAKTFQDLHAIVQDQGERIASLEKGE
ncbi:hypothetical protein [Xanthomonas translucens]|uniref:hypothetical protein n=1 Tax=Xanthomonas campestris pv. translucens TaxID=343 RepID=UPI00071E90A6